MKWNDADFMADEQPKPNTWVMIYQRFSEPNYTVGRLHYEKLADGWHRKYWEWFSNEALGRQLICPGNEFVMGWMEFPDFYYPRKTSDMSVEEAIEYIGKTNFCCGCSERFGEMTSIEAEETCNKCEHRRFFEFVKKSIIGRENK